MLIFVMYKPKNKEMQPKKKKKWNLDQVLAIISILVTLVSIFITCILIFG